MDTVFVSKSQARGMEGLYVAQLKLLFSFFDRERDERHECALISWFKPVGICPDKVTGMWVVEREEIDGQQSQQVIPMSSVVRGAHLLPVYGEGRVPEHFSYDRTLTEFERFFVNPFIDHHAHELLSV